MWEGLGKRARIVARAALALTIGVLLGALGAGPVAADPSGVTVDVALELREDGALAVRSVITAPSGHSVAQRLPLDVPVEGNRTQHYTVTDVRADNGTAGVRDGALQVSAPGGTTTVEYTVRGSVENGPELQQLTWPLAAGYSSDIDTLTARFASPTPQPDSPLCGIGRAGERRLCTLTETDATGRVTMRQNGLPQGRVAVFTVLLPAGTVRADARFTAATPSAPADRSTPGLIALSAAVVVALAVAGYAMLRRRADVAAAGSAGPTADLLVPAGSGAPGGAVAFASPDGVLPGQIGALTDAQVRPSDIGATVLDLAVRGYLWIAELPSDFQISRRAPLDDAVTSAERAVVDAILPDGAESTTTGELAGGARRVEFVVARRAVRDAVTARGWRRGGDRARRVALAFGVAGVGALVGLGCAFTGTTVLYGLAVVVLGLGLAAAALMVPDRTVSGSRLAAGLAGMRRYLIATNVGALAPAERALLFDRALPYAHAFGDLSTWIGTWGGTVDSPLDWYRSAHATPVAGVATLSAVLDGIAARSAAAEND